MGLDLGLESPETIALSVLAEIQQSLTAATALPLRQAPPRSLSETIAFSTACRFRRRRERKFCRKAKFSIY
jgi:hypothetical protein